MKRLSIFSSVALAITLMSTGLCNAQGAEVSANKPAPHASNKIKQVDINAASRKELMNLPGIGTALAERIIAGRPYGSKAWLVTKKIIPEKTYLGIQGQIIAIQHVPIRKADTAMKQPVK